MVRRSLLQCAVVFSLLVTACTTSVPVGIDTAQEPAALAQPTSESETSVPEPTASTESDEPATITSGELGASSPAAAVEALLGAANNGDPLGILSVIVPAERELLGGLYDRMLEGMENEWPQFGGQSAVAGADPDVFITGDLTVEELSPYLAFVSAPKIEASFNNPTDPLASFLWSRGVWGQGDPDRPLLKATRFYDFYSDFPPESPLGVVTVQIDGRWYISFARSWMEGMRRGVEVDANFSDAPPSVAGSGATTPNEAAINFAAALESRSMTQIAATLAPGEAQAFLDYAPSMSDWLLTATRDLQVGAGVDAATIVEGDDNDAVVELDAWNFSLVGDFDDESGEYEETFDMVLEVDGLCPFVVESGDRTSGCFPFTDETAQWATLPLADGWRGFRVATVKVGDEWAVSLYDTAAMWLDPFTQAPLFTAVYAPGLRSRSVFAVVNEKAKSLPAGDPAGPVAMTSVADDRIVLARVMPAVDGRMDLAFAGAVPAECEIFVWNTNMVSTDWSNGERPRWFQSASCEKGLNAGLFVPSGVELTVMVASEADVVSGAVLTFAS